MTGVPWSRFEAEAPDFAAAIQARFAAHVHHVIGTLRPDGSPRLSGTEVRFEDGQLRVGMMPGSHKLADVLRDPRVEIHSAPLETDLAAGDAKVAGRLRGAGDVEGQDGTMHELEVELISLVRVDGDELVFTTWRPGRAVETIRRR